MVDDEIKVHRVPNAANISLQFSKWNFCSYLTVIWKKKGFIPWRMTTPRVLLYILKKGFFVTFEWRMCAEFVLYYFFQRKKKINKLAFGCTDFFVVEILGCCGRKPLPILAQMLIVFCNSSCCHCDVLSCVLFVLSPRLKWLLITYRAAAKKWAIWYSFLLFSFILPFLFLLLFFIFFFFFSVGDEWKADWGFSSYSSGPTSLGCFPNLHEYLGHCLVGLG